MAIYHFSVKPVQRSKGRTATAAAAYRAGCLIVDERTGEVHDYRRRSGVVSAEIFTPKNAPMWVLDRAALWNAAEMAEKRKDGTPAREYEVALPAELNGEQRRLLVVEFCREMADHEGCVVDAAIHMPGKGGDHRNHHAHILRTTRRLDAGSLGDKLDTEKAGRKRVEDLDAVRARWAVHCNRALERAGHSERVDHRSNVARGIDAIPTMHNGPAITALERRKAGKSWAKFAREEDRAVIQHVQAENDLTPWPEGIELEAAISAAKHEHRLEEKRSQDEQERQRWEVMSAVELAAEIKRLRSPAVAGLVERDKDVLHASGYLAQLQERHEHAVRIAREAEDQADEWRKQNPLRARLHEKGLRRAPYLREREEAQAWARKELGDIAPHIEAAQQAHRDAMSYARERIRQEQAPALSKVSELEQLRKQKIQQEMEQERQRAADQERRSAPGRGHRDKDHGPSL